MRFHVLPLTVYRTPGRQAPPSISWQVVDVAAGMNTRAFPRKVVASCREEAHARQIADHFNGLRAERERELDGDWQRCLDFANKQTAEARRERDTWRQEYNRANALIAKATEAAMRAPIGWTAEEVGKLIFERDEARAKLQAIKDALK